VQSESEAGSVEPDEAPKAKPKRVRKPKEEAA
jgi:hypothetical protein